MTAVTDEMVDAASVAIRDADDCDYAIDGGTAFCDDARLPEDLRQSDCRCKIGARAALEAAERVRPKDDAETRIADLTRERDEIRARTIEAIAKRIEAFGLLLGPNSRRIAADIRSLSAEKIERWANV